MENFKDVLQAEGVRARGYGIVPKLVLQDKRLTIEAKAIYSYFCSYAGAGITAFPTITKLCFDLNISKDRYYKHFNFLKEFGYITVIQARKDNNKFSHNIYTLVEKPCSQFGETVETSASEPCHDFKETGKADTPNLTTNINSYKSNNININSQSVSPGQNPKKDRQTDGLTDRVSEFDKLLDKLEIDNFPKQQQLSIKALLTDVYYNYKTADSLGINLTILQKQMQLLTYEALSIALHKYNKEVSDIHNHIKNKKLYFAKVLYNCIIESELYCAN